MQEPLHRQVTRRLRDLISSDEYQQGERLPSEPELAKQMGVSRATLREALNRLESIDLIQRVHGIGTFVRSKTPSIALNLSIPRSITELVSSMGMIPGTASMSVEEQTVFPDDMERLDVPPGSKIYRIERVRTANGQPVAYTIDTIPAWIMQTLPEHEEGDDFSLMYHLRIRCGVRFARTRGTLMPVHNIRTVADRLGIDPSSHIFFFEGIDHDEEGTPVMVSKEYFAPWIFRFVIERTFD